MKQTYEVRYTHIVSGLSCLNKWFVMFE